MIVNSKSGRPYKFNRETSNAILEAISHHIPYRIAAESNGICERTFYNWLAQGSKDMNQGIRSDFSQLLQSLRKIEADKIAMHLNKITGNRKGHRGSQWILEHVFWKYFSSKAFYSELNERVERLEIHS